MQRTKHHLGKVGIAQLAGSDIDGDHKVMRNSGMPCSALFTGLKQYKLAQSVNEVCVFGKRNNNGRGHRAIYGVIPPQQGFHACHALCRVVALRLKHKIKLTVIGV